MADGRLSAATPYEQLDTTPISRIELIHVIDTTWCHCFGDLECLIPRSPPVPFSDYCSPTIIIIAVHSSVITEYRLDIRLVVELLL